MPENPIAGGVGLDETHVKIQTSMHQGDVGDPMIMRFYNDDKNFVGEVVFRKS